MADKHFIRTNIPPTASLPELLCRQASQISGRNMRTCMGCDFDGQWYWIANGSGTTAGYSSTARHTARLASNNAAVNESGSITVFDSFGGGPITRQIVNPRTERWMAYARGRFLTGVSNQSTSQMGWGVLDEEPSGVSSDPKVMVGAIGSVSTTNFIGAATTAGGGIASVDSGIALDTAFHKFHIYADVDDGLLRLYMDNIQFGTLDLATAVAATPMNVGFMLRTGSATQASRIIECDAMYVVTEEAE